MPPYCEFHEMFHSLPEECYTMRTAAYIGRKLAARREKAERIAREVADAAWNATPANVPGPQKSHDYTTALEAARAAALAALTEKESA